MNLSGHFAVFNTPTEINSAREGNFIETVARGAFRKTIAENRDSIRVLLSHGSDPQLGDKPLGPLTELREDARGGWYSVPLLDGVPELVVSGLRAGLYGASFRFQTVREEFVAKPGRSASNPRGIPERTLTEVKLFELGPTPWPAYKGTSANARTAGDTLELRMAGRVEVLPVGLAGSGSTPITMRRLRAYRYMSSTAVELMKALERGERVSLVWSRSSGVSGRSLGRPQSRTTRRRPAWQLS